jgi:hypothetical protein
MRHQLCKSFGGLQDKTCVLLKQLEEIAFTGEKFGEKHDGKPTP